MEQQIIFLAALIFVLIAGIKLLASLLVIMLNIAIEISWKIKKRKMIKD